MKKRPAARLRALLGAGRFVDLPSAFDPITARLAQDLGYAGVYNGGFVTGASSCIGEPLLTMSEQIGLAASLARAVDIPVVMDAGAAWGEPLHAMRTVRECIRAGLSGIHIEDQHYPKRAGYHAGGARVIPLPDFRDKIRYACRQRDALDADFVIIARSDACRSLGLKEAMKRVHAGADAGADLGMLFPRTHEEAVRAPKLARVPLVYVQSRGNRDGRPVYNAAQIADMGYAMCIDAILAIGVHFHHMRAALLERRRTGDYTGLTHDQIVTARAQAERLIGLDDAYRIERETVDRPSKRRSKLG